MILVLYVSVLQLQEFTYQCPGFVLGQVVSVKYEKLPSVLVRM